jgi:hypothetical protein
LLVLSVLLVTLFAFRRFRHSTAVPVVASPVVNSSPTTFDVNAPPDSRRTVFPYSVVPGGVRDAQELNAVIAKDSVVARHYSDFQLSKAHTIRLDRSTAMYVSYRLNDRVYWTRNRMLIPAGETLISDGKNLARVRCGNRLSMIAAKPVSLAEPPREKLETPAFIPPLLADLPPGDGSETLAALPAAMPPLPLFPPGPGIAPGSIPIIVPPLFPPGVPPSSKSSIPPPGSTVPPPPVPAPEPASWQLLLAGTLLFVLAGALRHR